MNLVDLAGWLGAVGVLIAYTLATHRGITFAVQAINAVSAVLLVVNAGAHHAAPVVGLNLAWVVIAFAGMAKLRRGNA